MKGSDFNLSSHYIDIMLSVLFALLLPFSVYYSLNVPGVVLAQGVSHRIFYFHVSVAWVALYAPVISSIAGILYLWKKEEKWDMISESMCRLSLIFSIAVLFSGPIWAKSNWGVYWDWTDARLQSFFALFLGLCGYFLLRNLIPDILKQAKIASIFTVFISLNSLLTWGAVRWMDNPGNHPGSVLGKGGMDSEMKTAFYLNVLSYHILFLILSIILYRLVRTERLSKRLLYSET